MMTLILRVTGRQPQFFGTTENDLKFKEYKRHLNVKVNGRQAHFFKNEDDFNVF